MSLLRRSARLPSASASLTMWIPAPGWWWPLFVPRRLDSMHERQRGERANFCPAGVRECPVMLRAIRGSERREAEHFAFFAAADATSRALGASDVLCDRMYRLLCLRIPGGDAELDAAIVHTAIVPLEVELLRGAGRWRGDGRGRSLGARRQRSALRAGQESEACKHRYRPWPAHLLHAASKPQRKLRGKPGLRPSTPSQRLQPPVRRGNQHLIQMQQASMPVSTHYGDGNQRVGSWQSSIYSGSMTSREPATAWGRPRDRGQKHRRVPRSVEPNYMSCLYQRQRRNHPWLSRL